MYPNLSYANFYKNLDWAIAPMSKPENKNKVKRISYHARYPSITNNSQSQYEESWNLT